MLKITEATKEMKSNDVLSGYTSNSAFADVFDDYMKVVKRCDSTNLDYWWIHSKPQTAIALTR